MCSNSVLANPLQGHFFLACENGDTEYFISISPEDEENLSHSTDTELISTARDHHTRSARFVHLSSLPRRIIQFYITIRISETMPVTYATHRPTTRRPPTSATSDAARPQGLGRIPINYLRLSSPIPTERSLSSPRLGQPILPGSHQRSSSPESESSGASVDMDRDEDGDEDEESNRLDTETQIMFHGATALTVPIYPPPAQDMAQAGPQHPNRPTVHWAEPMHTEIRTARDNDRENTAIRDNTRANTITVSDAELVRRAEDNQISQLFQQKAGVKFSAARCLHENDHIRVHGRSCEITSISVNPVVVRIVVDLMENGYILEVRPSHQVAVSASPIPEEAIISSSAAMLVERDYTFLKGRPCMLTRVTAPRIYDEAREMHVVGVDLETGNKVEATLVEETIVLIASKPLGKFVPKSLLGLGVARVAAASVVEGYYMVIEGRACKVVCVKYPERPCKERCWRRVRMVGMDLLSSTTDLTVFRGVDVDMDSMVTVGRHGIDPGPCDPMSGGNILGHMARADDLLNNITL